MPYVRQTNFAAGELDPKLWGRTDLPHYKRGLRTCRNFFISKQGAAVSRPGSIYVGEAKLGADDPNGAVRLIPFTYSDDVSYVLLFGHQYVRFVSRSEFVTDESSAMVELATSYLASELAALQFCQSGDVLFLTHPNHPPRKLSRLAHASWSLSDISFSPPDPYFASPENAGLFASDPFLLGTLPADDAEHPAREWTWAVTVIGEDAAGARFESKAFIVRKRRELQSLGSPEEALPAKISVYPDRPVTVAIALDDFGTQYPYRVVAFNIYRGRGELFGLVGTTQSLSFVDVGEEPDYAVQPPQGINPFDYRDKQGVVLGTERPAAVAFFQDRLCFGGTSRRPGLVVTSAAGDYANFDQHQLVHTADESLLFELAARRREEIRTYHPLSRLLIGTNSTVWSLGGAAGAPLSFDSVEAVVEDEVGVRALRFLQVDDMALYVRNKGTGVRGLLYRPSQGGFGTRYFQGLDASGHSQHLFLNYDVVDWTYAEDPWGLVWAVRSDGKLLSFSYVPDQQMAWTTHTTQFDGAYSAGDGRYKAICAIPETTEDAVYVAVHRIVEGAKRTYIERLTSRVSEFISLDCAKVRVITVPDEPGPTVPITGLSHLEGRSVYATALSARQSNAVYGPFTVLNGRIELPEIPQPNTYDTNNELVDDLVHVAVGLIFGCYMETLDLASAEVRMRQKTVVEVGIEVDQSRGLLLGSDVSHLDEWRQRAVGDSYNGISAATEFLTMTLEGTWNQRASFALAQGQPLPVTVLGLTSKVDSGD